MSYRILGVILPTAVLFSAFLGLNQEPGSVSRALTRDQIILLVNAGMETDRLLQTVAERGVGFELTGQDLEAIRKAGADPLLLKSFADIAVGQSREPLSKDLLLELVNAHADDAKLIQAIQERGIDVPLVAKEFDDLKSHGATEALIKALRDVNPRPINAGQVARLVTAGVTTKRAEMLVKRRGY